MEHKMVLLYNHADPDESFVTMLTQEQIDKAYTEECEFSKELMEIAKASKVKMPAICYYA